MLINLYNLSNIRYPNQLYRLIQEKYPELIEDLIIIDEHSNFIKNQLEHDSNYQIDGIYANGLLVESTCKKIWYI